MLWMLDTNAWIDYLKNPASRVRQHLGKRLAREIVVCSVVRAELLHGTLKYGVPARRTALVEETLRPFRSLPFDDAAAERYAWLRHDLERAGSCIGPNDLFIAAICLANDCVLVSANTDEFRRVDGLLIENWLIGPLH